MPRVTLSELARRLGHNKGYIYKLKLRGVLEFDAQGLIDEDAARAAIAQSRDPSRRYMDEVNQRQRANHQGEDAKEEDEGESEPLGTPPPSANVNFMRARTMREVLAAKTAQLEYKKLLAQVVNAQDIYKAATDAAAKVRQSLEQLPDKLAERLGAESDAAQCHKLLTEEIDLALGDLADLCERFATKSQGASEWAPPITT
jgi:hypothetical protein